MSDGPELVDGCEHCGNRVAVSPEHRERCAAFYEARRSARVKVEQFGISPVCVDDLFAHLTTPRAGGPWCTAEAAVSVVECIVALGWRPVVGATAPERHVVTRDARGGVL